MKIDKYLIFALIFALLNMGAILMIFGFQEYGDTIGYKEVIHLFQGQGAEVVASPWRMLRPLGPLIALPFEFLGEGAGLIAQNIVFYLLCAFLIFKITDLIYNNKKQALLASVFFVTATPVLEVGLAYLIDTGAWFFYLLSIYLTLAYFKTRNAKLITLNGFLSGMGVLMKENGGLGILFFALMILLSGNFGIKEKILKIMHFAMFFLIPIIVIQILVFKYYRLTYFDWYAMCNISLLKCNMGLERGGLSLLSIKYFSQLFRVLGILWVFFWLGLFREWREKNWDRIKIYLALIPSSISFVLWSVGGGGRVAFIFAPLGILLATYGCKKIKPLFMVPIVLVILAINYIFVLVNQEIPFIEIIYTLLFSRGR